MCHEAALWMAPGPSITRRVQEHHCQDMQISLLGHRNVTARMSSSEDIVCAPAHPNASRSLAAHRPFRSGCLWDVHDLQQSHLQSLESLASERSVKPGELLHAGRVAGGSLEEGRNQRLWWTHRRNSRVERSDSGSA